jgi:NADH-quinone oxidoreductase subunit N
MNIYNDLYNFSPEFILILAICLLLVSSFLKINSRIGYLISLGALFIYLFLLFRMKDTRNPEMFYGMITFDNLTLFFRYFSGVAGILGVLLSMISSETNDRQNFDNSEYLVLLFSMILGMVLMVSSNNFLMLYIGIEFVSIVSYLLTGFSSRVENKKSAEASLKYVIYGACASGIMIYGISLLYGKVGSLAFYDVKEFLKIGQISKFYILISILFIFTGIAYKIAAVPFHMWCPDVYEGAPTPITGLLSIGPKAAGFGVILRIFYNTLGEERGSNDFVFLSTFNWPVFLSIISAATMTFGNLAALTQHNIKRLLAYSSIAHAGVILMGVASASISGISAILFYLVVYMIMNIGAFLIVILINNRIKREDIFGYKGLAWQNKYLTFLAIVFGIFLFSLTGIPPFAGFIGKFYIFLSLVEKGSSYYWLLFVGILNTVISLYYYARIIKFMFLDKPTESYAHENVPILSIANAMLVILAFFTLLLGVYWEPMYNLLLRYVYF